MYISGYRQFLIVNSHLAFLGLTYVNPIISCFESAILNINSDFLLLKQSKLVCIHFKPFTTVFAKNKLIECVSHARNNYVAYCPNVLFVADLQTKRLDVTTSPDRPTSPDLSFTISDSANQPTSSSDLSEIPLSPLL